MDGFTSLDQRVRTAICYAHLFQDAHTLEEIATVTGGDPAQIQSLLRSWCLDGSVVQVADRFFLPNSERPDLDQVKERQSAVAESVMDAHQALLTTLVGLPWVRLLTISGSTGRGGSVRDLQKMPDLDLFMVVEPGSLHIVRLLLKIWEIVERIAVRARGTGPRPAICANYVTDASFQEVTNQSYFTAADSLRVRVLKGESAYRTFLSRNRWIQRYFPVPIDDTPRQDPERGPLLREGVNVGCFAALAATSWLKARLTGRPFHYSWKFRFDRNNCLRRAAIAGGGYQPQIAGRFAAVLAHHWGSDPELVDFLFPNTRATGVVVDGRLAPSVALELWPDG